MNLFIAHMNFVPFAYGIVLFLSALFILKNFMSFQILRGLTVLAFMWIGFAIHGDASDTRMGVAVGALLLDITWPLFMPKI